MTGRCQLALAAGLLSLVCGGGVVRSAVDPDRDTRPPADDAATGANLDWAVDTTRGPWCTDAAPRPDLRLRPLTIEGWFKPTQADVAAVLVDVWDADARRSLARVALPADALPGRWTHVVAVWASGGTSVTTWNAEQGERRSPAPAAAASAATGRVQVCVGGSTSSANGFSGLVDEVRLWTADVPLPDVQAWRHRRVSEAQAQRVGLLAYWPFQAGQGATQADRGRLGPLRSTAPEWVALPRLDYGPILRAVQRRSARVLFHARAGAGDAAGAEREWTAGLEIGTSEDLRPGTVLPAGSTPVVAADDYVAHIVRDDLAPQTRYYYAPLVDGRRGLDPGPGGFPSFVTLPDLGGRNADFTAAFFADQHVHGPTPTSLAPFAVAAGARPLFWAQLGDVAGGNLDGATDEHRRSREHLQALWVRAFAPGTPQADFAARFGLNLATVSDHEITDNFSLNWHLYPFAGAATPAEATLHDRVEQYDRSLARWWSYFGWGDSFDDRLGRVARVDRGESVMAEAPSPATATAGQARVCLEGSVAGSFAAGDFVSLADQAPDVLLTRVRASESDAGCAGGRSVTLERPPARDYSAQRGATLAVGARYARPAHYRAWQPFPFVEFFVADTTSFRGDPYERRAAYAKEANRDVDHSRYPWDATRPEYIYGDRPHGANRTTDGVRSWLGPTQRAALLEALATSRAPVIVVAAGYPLYSFKFERSPRYWEAREAGFDFAPEVEGIVAALERLDRLVLWVHGDGHTPALVRLRRNVYQLQVGATFPFSDRPGHRTRTLVSGSRSEGDTLGGGYLIAGHQPDLSVEDSTDDVFMGALDQFAGYLRLYFHPGQEALRSSETHGLSRGASDREVHIAAAADPAFGNAARQVVGKVVRLRFGEETAHSVVAAYRYEPGHAVLTLEDPVVKRAPDELRVLIDAVPWVECRWFDARGQEWRDFTFVLRKDL